MHKTQWKKLSYVSFALIILLTASLSYVLAQSGTTFTISSGVYPLGSYTLWMDGSTYYAKNAYGANDFSGTDFITVFNSARDSLTSGGTILLTEGVFSISGEPMELKDNIWVKGSGINATILRATERLIEDSGHFTGGVVVKSYWHGIYPRNTSWNENLRLTDLTVDANDVNQYVVSFTMVSNARITDIEAIKFKNYESQGIGILLQQSNYTIIENCYVHDASVNVSQVDDLSGVWLTRGVPHQFNIVRNVHVYDLTSTVGHGFSNRGFVIGENGASNDLISGGLVKNVDGFGVHSTYGFRNRVENLIIDGEGNNGWRDAVMLEGVNETEISGITIQNWDASSDGIYLSDCHDNKIVNNDILGSINKAFIVAGDSANNILSNNLVKESATGIYFGDTEDYNFFTENIFVNNTNVLGEAGGHTGGGNNTWHRNIGFVTENSGNTTISASTSVVVNHKLAGIPDSVTVTLGTTGAGDYYVDTLTATQFTVHVANSGTYTVYWRAKYIP